MRLLISYNSDFLTAQRSEREHVEWRDYDGLRTLCWIESPFITTILFSLISAASPSQRKPWSTTGLWTSNHVMIKFSRSLFFIISLSPFFPSHVQFFTASLIPAIIFGNKYSLTIRFQLCLSPLQTKETHTCYFYTAGLSTKFLRWPIRLHSISPSAYSSPFLPPLPFLAPYVDLA